MRRVTIQPASPDRKKLDIEIARLRGLDVGELRARWHTVFRRRAPAHLPRHLLYRILAYRLQADRLGDLDAETLRFLDRSGSAADVGKLAAEFNQRRTDLKAGTVLVREWDGQLHRVMVLADGFAWNDKIYPSLSKVAFAMTGTRWNGPRFFGLRDKPSKEGSAMKIGASQSVRCAIYTRVSTDQGLEQDFNSLDAQRDAAEAYIRSQAHAAWTLIRSQYNDGGYSGGSTDRPALQRLLSDVRARKVDVIVVYKVDRLTRSLADFAKLVELFDGHGVSFVSVTQQFNTTTSMGRLTLNVLLSFAQFEREVTSERIRDKIAASKRKGLWVGGMVPLGYKVKNRKVVVIKSEADAGPDHLPSLPGTGQSQSADAGPSPTKDPHQSAEAIEWPGCWREPLNPGPPCPSSSKPVLHRRGRL